MSNPAGNPEPRRRGGTSLSTYWQGVLDGARRWTPPRVPTVVVAPHPDDEVLSTGGLIAHQTASGVPVTVVAVTDGEAAYADRQLGVDLAEVRRDEQERALAHLGVDGDRIVRLGFADGDVTQHERELGACLSEIFADVAPGPRLVVAPASIDHHCDHEAVGRATVSALFRERPDVRRDVVLVESLFWAWHHLDAAVLARRSMVRFALSDHMCRRRATALAEHRSQIGEDVTDPLLTADDLEPLRWRAEHYLVPDR